MSRFRCLLALVSASSAACVEPGTAGLTDPRSRDSADSAIGDSGIDETGTVDSGGVEPTSEAVWYDYGHILLSCDEAGGVRGWLFNYNYTIDLLEGTILDGYFQGSFWHDGVETTLAGPAEMEDGLCPSRLNVEVVSETGTEIRTYPAESTPPWPSGQGPRDVEQSACLVAFHWPANLSVLGVLAQSADGHLSGFVPPNYAMDGDVQGSSVVWTKVDDGEQETTTGVSGVDFTTCTGEGNLQMLSAGANFFGLDRTLLVSAPDTLRFRVHTPPDGPGVAWLVAPIGG